MTLVVGSMCWCIVAGAVLAGTAGVWVGLAIWLAGATAAPFIMDT